MNTATNLRVPYNARKKLKWLWTYYILNKDSVSCSGLGKQGVNFLLGDTLTMQQALQDNIQHRTATQLLGTLLVITYKF